jgi:hypothetical protein
VEVNNVYLILYKHFDGGRGLQFSSNFTEFGFNNYVVNFLLGGGANMSGMYFVSKIREERLMC